MSQNLSSAAVLIGTLRIKRPPIKEIKIVFQDRLLLNAGQEYCRMLRGEHSAILLTFIKLPFVVVVVNLFCIISLHTAAWYNQISSVQ